MWFPEDSYAHQKINSASLRFPRLEPPVFKASLHLCPWLHPFPSLWGCRHPLSSSSFTVWLRGSEQNGLLWNPSLLPSWVTWVSSSVTVREIIGCQLIGAVRGTNTSKEQWLEIQFWLPSFSFPYGHSKGCASVTCFSLTDRLRTLKLKVLIIRISRFCGPGPQAGLNWVLQLCVASTVVTWWFSSILLLF